MQAKLSKEFKKQQNHWAFCIILSLDSLIEILELCTFHTTKKEGSPVYLSV